jgi:hypothetical protein
VFLRSLVNDIENWKEIPCLLVVTGDIPEEIPGTRGYSEGGVVEYWEYVGIRDYRSINLRWPRILIYKIAS